MQHFKAAFAMSVRPILAPFTVSITDLRRNPNAVIDEADKAPVAVLNHNRATAYVISARVYEELMDRLEDAELADTVRKRRGGKTVKVTLDDL
ncbi:type II toxin-antitoxin system Phd/YefM family antitoxin [Achromobacter aloeverae]|nr:type II toxin-antitoxin system prevent-host-death family antitoxin [Achromobacter aloeverae]